MARLKSPKAKKSRQTDWHLWNEVKLTVNPLRKKLAPEEVASEDKPKKLEATGAQKKQKSAKITSASNTRHQTYINSKNSFTPDLSNHSLPEIEPRMHRHVRRGRIPIEASIDLHGMTQNVARATLYNFIQDRSQRGDRTLLIITGKGQKSSGYGSPMHGGVLRQMLPVWLKEPQLAPLISGIEVSGRHHGGEGAFYVRLKNIYKNTPERN
ncbi:MAG: Smr/MutS family protein [Devosiaceae bacterium]|nr:Smr/MutS family protein [Devosiaceae bacterium]